MLISKRAFDLTSLMVLGVSAQTVVNGITTGTLGNASVTTNNPSGAEYIAQIPDTAFDTTAFPNGGNVKGSIQAVSTPDGNGVMLHVEFSGLPETGGPFLYHIHDQPVPASGNCSDTLAHLDPYQRGETPACNSAAPETCQVGDLSGKHGEIIGTCFEDTYTDYYVSTLSGTGAYLGNRSFVLHFVNTTRVTCANFEPVPVQNSAYIQVSTVYASVSALSPVASAAAAPTGSSGASILTTNAPTTRAPTTRAPTSTMPAIATVAAAYSNTPAQVLAIGAAAIAVLL